MYSKSILGKRLWAKVLELRYQPGKMRTHVKSMFKTFSKDDSILVLFHNKAKKSIEYRFYLDTNNVPDIHDESDVNMFGGFMIDIIMSPEYETPDTPAYIKKQAKFFRTLLQKK
jgi:hypothetical protein